MASAVHTQNDENLLISVMSAIMGIDIHMATHSPESGCGVSLFNHHRTTYSFGDVGDTPYMADNKIEIVKTLTGKTITCCIDRNNYR